jgi:hypothetical protein
VTKCERAAYVIDLFRTFPRIFLCGYGALCWKSALWFMALEKPSPEQAAFVTLLAGFFVPLTNWYMQNGVSRDSAKQEPPTTVATMNVSTGPKGN